MYSSIQEQKALGYTKESVARHLGLAWRTVDKYWDMSISEYQKLQANHKATKLGKHLTTI